MALTQPQRIQISGEQLDIPLKVQSALDTQAQLAGVKTELLNKDGSLQIFFDKYNSSINAYQNEQKWLEGTTYSTVANQDCIDSAQKLAGNKFFPTDGSWTRFQPKKDPSSVGLPTSSFANNEIAKAGELTPLLDFLVNGQNSAVSDDTLGADYVPGSGTMTVTFGGQTPGNLIIVAGGGFSGLFKVDSVTSMTLTVTEVVAPDGTLPMTTSDVIEDIIPFTNNERNTLTSTTFQNVLEGLSSLVETAVNDWKTTVDNQLIELNGNFDSRSPQASEILTAKNDATNAQSIINAWLALPTVGSTGNDSRLTDNNVTTLTNEVSDRQAFSVTRSEQIPVALGTINQIADGTFTGSGLYYERFKQIDLRINLAGGPLTEYYEKGMADAALTQIANTAIETGNTYNNELRTEKLSENANGTNTVQVASSAGFSVTNTIYVVADTLPELTGTITTLNPTSITLSLTVPSTYTSALRARIYKQL